MVLFTIYRVVVTSFFWPILYTRSSAWSSIMGFHCGSMRKTWFAAVKFNLEVSVTMRYLPNTIVIEGESWDEDETLNKLICREGCLRDRLPS